MDKIAIGYIGLAASLVLIGLRVPIGVALGLVSFVGIATIVNLQAAWGIVTAVPFHFVGDWNLTAVPMFLLMGYVASATGITEGLFRAMRLFLSRLPGGLAIASVAACALFSAASGSSVAVSAAMARIATPEMLRYRYEVGLATGVIASAGTLGSLIPPSILMVLYGYFAEVSIGKLFIAGVLPGILSAGLYSAMIATRVALKPSLAPPVDEHPTWAERMQSLGKVWPLPVLVLGVLLGIFLGLFTPTEGGAVGVALAMVIAAVQRTLTWSSIRASVVVTLSATASIFMVVIGTVLLTRFIALSGVADHMSATLMAFGRTELVVIVMVSILYLILGCFLDSIGLLLLTLPIVLPLVRGAGMDLIWFGIIVIKLLEIGLVTPPVGLNVYVMKGALGNLVTLTQVFRGVAWFVATDVVTLSIIVAFPWLSLVLPSMME